MKKEDKPMPIPDLQAIKINIEDDGVIDTDPDKIYIYD